MHASRIGDESTFSNVPALRFVIRKRGGEEKKGEWDDGEQSAAQLCRGLV